MDVSWETPRQWEVYLRCVVGLDLAFPWTCLRMWHCRRCKAKRMFNHSWLLEENVDLGRSWPSVWYGHVDRCDSSICFFHQDRQTWYKRKSHFRINGSCYDELSAMEFGLIAGRRIVSTGSFKVAILLERVVVGTLGNLFAVRCRCSLLLSIQVLQVILAGKGHRLAS